MAKNKKPPPASAKNEEVKPKANPRQDLLIIRSAEQVQAANGLWISIE